MKLYSICSFLIIIMLSSCASVRVTSDYDDKADFSSYKNFAFYKPGIDKADISDLDKKRILRAIEGNLITKGFQKSDTPDILISIFTKTRDNVNVYQNNMNIGYGWGPFFLNTNYNTVSRNTEGTLYIDLIDAKNQELVWQGIGTGILTQDVARKQEKINEIVNAILTKYPPQL